MNERKWNNIPYSIDELKARLYRVGRHARTLDHCLAVATKVIREMIDQHGIAKLESGFPNGFGLLATKLRATCSTP